MLAVARDGASENGAVGKDSSRIARFPAQRQKPHFASESGPLFDRKCVCAHPSLMSNGIRSNSLKTLRVATLHSTLSKAPRHQRRKCPECQKRRRKKLRVPDRRRSASRHFAAVVGTFRTGFGMRLTTRLTFVLAVSSVLLWNLYPACLRTGVVVPSHFWCVGRNLNPYFRLRCSS